MAAAVGEPASFRQAVSGRMGTDWAPPARRARQHLRAILTFATSATTAQAQLSAIWDGFNHLAGSTGFGNPDPADYFLIMHPRRFAWLSGGSGNGRPGSADPPRRTRSLRRHPHDPGRGDERGRSLSSPRRATSFWSAATRRSASTRRRARERLPSASRPSGTRRSSSETPPPSSGSQDLRTRSFSSWQERRPGLGEAAVTGSAHSRIA